MYNKIQIQSLSARESPDYKFQDTGNAYQLSSAVYLI